MLHQQQRVADGASLTGCDYLRLNAEAFGVGDAAELEEVDVHVELDRSL
jgi:hypothetical protein